MRLNVVVALLSLASVVVSASPVKIEADDNLEVNWTAFNEEAMKNCCDNGGAVLLYFRANGCPVCKKVESEVWKDDEVRRMLADRNIATIQADLSNIPDAEDTSPSDKMKLLGITQVPSVAVYRNGESRPSAILSGAMVSEGVLKAILEMLPKPSVGTNKEPATQRPTASAR